MHKFFVASDNGNSLDNGEAGGEALRTYSRCSGF
jgi:hypothetical protein